MSNQLVTWIFKVKSGSLATLNSVPVTNGLFKGIYPIPDASLLWDVSAYSEYPFVYTPRTMTEREHLIDRSGFEIFNLDNYVPSTSIFSVGLTSDITYSTPTSYDPLDLNLFTIFIDNENKNLLVYKGATIVQSYTIRSTDYSYRVRFSPYTSLDIYGNPNVDSDGRILYDLLAVDIYSVTIVPVTEEQQETSIISFNLLEDRIIPELLPKYLRCNIQKEGAVGHNIQINIDAVVVQETVILDLSTVSLDLYNKLRLVYKLLDPDEITFYSTEFDWKYKPTSYDPNAQVYNVSETEYPVYNSSIVRQLLRNQIMPEFESFFNEIFNQNVVDKEYLDNLESILIKKITYLNSMKGSKEQIRFIMSIFAESIKKHLISVEPSPYWNFIYYICSDVPYENLRTAVKPIVHPCSWSDLYLEIPPQSSYNLQEKNITDINFLQHLYEKMTYLEFGYSDELLLSSFSNVNVYDLYSYKNFNFADYGNESVNLLYSNTLLTDECFQYDLFKISETIEGPNHHRFIVQYQKTGVGIEYEWKVWKDGYLVYHETTYFPEFIFETNDDNDVRLQLILKNCDQTIIIPAFSIDIYNQFLSSISKIDANAKYLDKTVDEPHQCLHGAAIIDFKSGSKLRFKPCEYSCPIDYTVVNLIAELEDSGNFNTIIVNPTTVEFLYSLAGIGLLYEWTIYKNSVLINTINTAENYLVLNGDSADHLEVYLKLKNSFGSLDLTLTTPFDYTIP